MSRFDSQASARFDKGMNYFNFFGNKKINASENQRFALVYHMRNCGTFIVFKASVSCKFGCF